jgi:hypothetical protein
MMLLADRLWRGRGFIMSERSRKARIVRSKAMPEIDREGPITLAAALCYVAAATHSKTSGEQQQMAALFYEDCRTDFKGVHISEAVEKQLSEFIRKASKK